MSQVLSIGAGMTPQVATPPASVQSTDALGGANQTAGAENIVNQLAVSGPQQSMMVSIASNVQSMVAQFGPTMASEDILRTLIILMLLQELLRQQGGGEQDSSQLLGALGNSAGQGGMTLAMTNESYSASFSMESTSFDMTAIQAYQGPSSVAMSGATTGLDVVQPTDTGAVMNAGDSGHQLDVVA